MVLCTYQDDRSLERGCQRACTETIREVVRVDQNDRLRIFRESLRCCYRCFETGLAGNSLYRALFLEFLLDIFRNRTGTAQDHEGSGDRGQVFFLSSRELVID